MKKLITAFLLFFILFFVSCGMPSYHDFTDAIHVSTVSTSNTEYDAGFRVTFSDSIFDYYFDTASPSVLLMYSIADGSGSLSSSFNSTIRNSGNYYNGIAATFDSNGRLANVNSTYDSKNIYLYKFTSASSDDALTDNVSNAPNYTFSKLNTAHDYYFMIKREPIQTSDNNEFRLIMDVFQDNIAGVLVTSIPLYRHNNSPFYNNIPSEIGENSDYFYYANLEGTYRIQLYLAVNVLPDTSSSFSNTYWSSLVRDSITITI